MNNRFAQTSVIIESAVRHDNILFNNVRLCYNNGEVNNIRRTRNKKRKERKPCQNTREHKQKKT